MIIIQKPSVLHTYIAKWKEAGRSVGFVPTMGALHEGHLSLLQEAKKSSDAVVCSIFVNPTQFNDPSDYEKYPVSLEDDIKLLEHAGTDILFLPSVNDVYATGTGNLESYDLGYLETVLEGKYRPGHFQGVCQVMNRLLNAVKPDHLYMGRKDYQQCMVVKKLISLMHIDTAFVACETLREPDGLAMSSRNRRLKPGHREQASLIYNVLQQTRNALAKQQIDELETRAIGLLQQQGFKVDYFEIADAANLALVNDKGDRKLVALVAAFLGDVRLIDNMQLN